MLYLGTSGWSYRHWTKDFYPAGLPPREQLSYLAQHFLTVELNASFYHLPPASSFAKWFADTPADFRFAVKVPRVITHTKRLGDVAQDWQSLLEHVQPLAHKLGVYLCQFPPSFKATEENLGRLETFVSYAMIPGRRVAFEFRHPSWFTTPATELFGQYQLCIVQADSSRYPHTPSELSSADFTYYRLHGPRKLYSSSYNDEELWDWTQLVQANLAAHKDVYVYFDNDFHSYALENAQRMQSFFVKNH